MTNHFFFQNSNSGFSPLSIGGLVTWINASSVVDAGEGKISVMNDFSENGNNATQNTGALRPTLVPDVLNGYPVIRFANGNYFNFVQNGTFPTGVTQIVVFKPDNTSSNNALFTKIVNELLGQFDSYIRGDNRFEWAYASSPTKDPISTTNFNVLGAYASTTGHGYFLNGVAQGTATGGSFNPANVGNLWFGSRISGNTNFIGDVAEAILYDRKLNDEEIIKISSYLMNKYSLANYPTPLSQFTNTKGTTLTQSGEEYILTDGSAFSSLSYTFNSLLPVNGQTYSYKVSAKAGTANTMTLRVIEDSNSNGDGTSFETIATTTFALTLEYQEYTMNYVHNFDTKCRLQIVVGTHANAGEGNIQLLDNVRFE